MNTDHVLQALENKSISMAKQLYYRKLHLVTSQCNKVHTKRIMSVNTINGGCITK